MKKSKAHRLRARLVAQGTSLRQWALLRGYNPKTVYAAITGKRNGPLTRQILTALDE